MKRHRERNHSHSNQPGSGLEISRLAAKILAEEGINDYLLAKQRAVQRLHLPDKTGLPKNADVQQQLVNHLELFDGKGLKERQKCFRRLACQLMELLAAFQPLAAGSVVDGVVTKTSRIQIHIFAPTPEHVATALLEKNIPYQLTEQTIRFTPAKTENKPAYNFLMDDTPITLCVFNENEMRKTVIDPVYGRSSVRLGINSLKILL